MRLLLDTHVLIWWDEGTRLKAEASRAIRDADQVFVSSASAWEIAIKASLGRLTTKRTVAEALADSHFDELPVYLRHAAEVRGNHGQAVGKGFQDRIRAVLVPDRRLRAGRATNRAASTCAPSGV